MKRHWCLLLVLVFNLSLAQAIEFQLTDIGPVKADSLSQAASINDRGDAVGYMIRNFHTYRQEAALMRDGKALDLMKRGGVRALGSAAAQINQHGVVVGTAEINAKGAYRLFVHDHGSLSLLRFPERGYGYATGLNNKGVLIGASWTAEGDCLCGFSYADGQWTALRSPVAGQRAEPRAINDSGLVVGWADFEVGRHARRKAVAWRGGTPEVLLDLGGRVSEAHGMNRLGDIVGGSHVRGLDTHHAYLIHDGQAIDLDGDAGSNSDAYAINDAGQVVGYRSTNDRSGAFLVHEGQMLWLEDLLAAGTPEGIQIVAANSINQQGQIVGQAFLPGKSGWHAILLTPMAR